MLRLRSHQVLRILATLCLLWLASCGPDPALNSDVPAASTVEPYRQPWHYRYGDSPKLANGAWAWASESPDPDPWEATSAVHNPPKRTGTDDLWLRTRLDGPSAKDPTMFLHEVDQCVEAYLDGVLIARFGPMDVPAQRFIAKRPLYLPLGAQYQQHMLTLHFRSVYQNIGIIRPPLIGGRAELLAHTLKKGLPFLIVGAISLVLGLGVFALYLVERRERLYLLYAVQCLVVSPYLLSRSLARGYLLDHPAAWRLVLVITFCLISAAMCAFVAQLFEGRWARYLRGLSLANLTLFTICLLLTVAGVIHLELFFRASLFFWLPFLLSIGAVALVGLFRGHADARILAWGLLLTTVLALPQVLSVLDLFDLGVDVRALVGLVFMIALGAILVRRYRAFQKRLTDYSAVMGMSLSSNEQGGSHEHAHSTLTALQRLLQAERAFMFLCRDDGTGLHILAGRDAQGRIGNLSLASSEHDQRVIDAALRKRRPVTRSRYIRRPTDQHEPAQSAPLRQSVMAAPLMVQGRLLGVLYLEADAGRREFAPEDLDILIELGNQVALTLTATRADDLEIKSTHNRKRLGEQWNLLQAATRLAAGELQTPIAVDERHELAPLAHAIENMRRDLLAKLRELESSHAAVQQLNADLRYQLDKRLQRAIQQAPPNSSAASLSKPDADGGKPSESHGPGLAPGALLGRHYRVVTLQAEDATSRLYEVQRRTDNRRFVAKVLTTATSPTLVARFAREAKILTAVRDPHIVSIVDIDSTAEGTPFLIMEQLHSTPLSQRRNLYGNRGLALPLVAQVVAGLNVLHENGIVHRNLQPANILISETHGELRVRLTDFGVSIAFATAQVDLNGGIAQTGQPAASDDDFAVSNSPEGRGIWLYRAPELYQGLRSASPHSDMFSLGLIAYELLTGEPPLPEPAAELRRREEPLHIPALRDKVNGLTPHVAELLDRCLHPDLNQRPSAAELLAALTDTNVSRTATRA